MATAPAPGPPSGCSPPPSSVKSLPPPCPKSPPEYPDLYGKRRELAKVQMLEREINFLEQEELKFVQGLQPASKCCKELSDYVVGNPDPLILTNRKIRKSCRFWKWLCGIPCFNFSWICYCCCSVFSCRPILARCCTCNPCPRTSNCCSSCTGCCNCKSCLPPPPNKWGCCFSSSAASCGCRLPNFSCCICGSCKTVGRGDGNEKSNSCSCCCPDLGSCFKLLSLSCCSKNGRNCSAACCTWKWWCCCPKVRRPRCCKCTKNHCNSCSNPCCCCPFF